MNSMAAKPGIGQNLKNETTNDVSLNPSLRALYNLWGKDEINNDAINIYGAVKFSKKSNIDVQKSVSPLPMKSSNFATPSHRY